MTTETVETTQPATDSDIARKIWLAGVGAYGRMFSETQGAIEKLAHGANEAFDQLVANGEAVEDKVRETIARSPQGEKVISMVEGATNKVKAFREERRAALDARIGKVRKSVSETLAPLNLAALGQAVEKLSAQVEALTVEVAALKAEKTSTAPAPARIARAKATDAEG
jgi:poly(hydroxyalkanoate) granule-associated protein